MEKYEFDGLGRLTVHPRCFIYNGSDAFDGKYSIMTKIKNKNIKKIFFIHVYKDIGFFPSNVRNSVQSQSEQGFDDLTGLFKPVQGRPKR